MKRLEKRFQRAIISNLRRKAMERPTRWATSNRIMGNPFPGHWTFKYHPWLLEMHDDVADRQIGQKAAQMGFTEWAINMAFYYLDVQQHNVLYVLPTTDDATDFSTSRFDPALEMSPALRDLFTDTNNVKLKRAGPCTLYVRGSHARSKLKSIPTPILVFDELDEMPKGMLALAEERQSGQNTTKVLALSTPTIEGKGINAEFAISTQNFYTFRCPCCSRYTELVYPECLVVTAEKLTEPKLADSHLICKECKGVLPHETKPEWLKHARLGGTGQYQKRFQDRDILGYHTSQLYSMVKACAPPRIASAVLRAQTDESRAQELHNSKLGLCYEAEGARVTETEIQDCLGTHVKRPGRLHSNSLITMGADIGSVLNVVVKEFFLPDNFIMSSLNDLCNAAVLFEGETSGSVDDFNELYQIFGDYSCNGGVIDAEPEYRQALNFAIRLRGRVLVCDYQKTQHGRSATVNQKDYRIAVNRTSWMDLSLGRYRNGSVTLPRNTSDKFKRQVREPVRIYKLDKWGNSYATYESVGADHFAHADTYAEIALPYTCAVATNQNIVEAY